MSDKEILTYWYQGKLSEDEAVSLLSDVIPYGVLIGDEQLPEEWLLDMYIASDFS